ncbi:hypothetical protein D3C77_685640 [compost metagenome]
MSIIVIDFTVRGYFAERGMVNFVGNAILQIHIAQISEQFVHIYFMDDDKLLRLRLVVVA